MRPALSNLPTSNCNRQIKSHTTFCVASLVGRGFIPTVYATERASINIWVSFLSGVKLWSLYVYMQMASCLVTVSVGCALACTLAMQTLAL